ncbi:sodium-coupled monocarboxylate transporter 2-like [Rhodnius prolixus]|uniref:sodium-coupled monocarboxylate transporter 2-like n=1 Tax=Rhodnius prolixus TaxID=13249 RepID=UPI003D18B334
MSSNENTVIENMSHQIPDFNWFEYTVFFGMLGASAFIGVYFGCLTSAENTVKEYMLGGRQMPSFPVALSLTASFISGITLLGIPAETYLYGTQLYLVSPAIVISLILLNIFYLPVLYNLGTTSLFEYLERRFNTATRCIGSLLNTISLLLYIPVVIYVPALAFNQATGMPMHILAPTVCFICIFYTTLGGLKAVVWSDALQSMFTLVSLVAVMFIGASTVGGFGNVFEISEKGERIELFNFDPDPFQRNTFWTVMFGSTITWTSYLALNPGAYQRYIALPSYRQAKIVSCAMVLGLIVLKSLSTLIGLVIYTKYRDCDPVETKVIQKVGQILPYFVMDVAGIYRGLTGLFLSGVVSTALSTMSTSLNSVAATLFEDYIKPLLPWKPNDKQSNFIMKTIVIVAGIISSALVFVVAKMGTIMQTAVTLNGVTSGITLFIFSFGMFIPWANAKGAIAGSVAGLLAVSWIALGGQIAAARGDFGFPGKETTVEHCPANMTLPEFNSTRFGNPGYGTQVFVAESVPLLYRISYLYFPTVGLLVSMIVGLTVSIVTGGQDLAELDPELIVPQLRWLIPHSNKKTTTKAPIELYHKINTNEINTVKLKHITEI